MTRRIVRTTRRVRLEDEPVPVATVHEREVDRVVTEGTETELDRESRALQRVDYVTQEIVPPTRTDVLEAHSWVRALEDLTHRQLLMLRDLDLRLRRLEDRGSYDDYASFERTTWWTLWGVLMVILGSALMVIILLIVTQLLR